MLTWSTSNQLVRFRNLTFIARRAFTNIYGPHTARLEVIRRHGVVLTVASVTLLLTFEQDHHHGPLLLLECSVRSLLSSAHATQDTGVEEVRHTHNTRHPQHKNRRRCTRAGHCQAEMRDRHRISRVGA